MAKYVSPGATYVDIFPIRMSSRRIIFCVLYADRAVKSHRYAVKYIPSWFPGAAFKRDAKRLRGLLETMTYRPFEQVKTNMVSTISGCPKTG